jgi:hypothetical protein
LWLAGLTQPDRGRFVTPSASRSPAKCQLGCRCPHTASRLGRHLVVADQVARERRRAGRCGSGRPCTGGSRQPGRPCR